MAYTHGLKGSTKGVYSGGPLEVDEAKAEAAITPGALLVRGATAGEVKEAGAGAVNVVGVALDNNFSQTAEGFLVDFAADEFVPYNVAVNGRFMGILAASQTVNHGDKLICSANGELTAFPATPAAGDSRKVVAVYLGKAAVTTGASETKRILCMFVG